MAPIFIVASVRVSSDGKKAVYATFDKDRSQQLFVVPLAGGDPKELVPPQRFTDLRARWSPDGKRIAYTSRLLDPNQPPRNHGAETYLKLVDPDGAHPVTLLSQRSIREPRVCN
jgi:Tol biopolymer transport system component